MVIPQETEVLFELLFSNPAWSVVVARNDVRIAEERAAADRAAEAQNEADVIGRFIALQEAEKRTDEEFAAVEKMFNELTRPIDYAQFAHSLKLDPQTIFSMGARLAEHAALCQHSTKILQTLRAKITTEVNERMHAFKSSNRDTLLKTGILSAK